MRVRLSFCKSVAGVTRLSARRDSGKRLGSESTARKVAIESGGRRNEGLAAADRCSRMSLMAGADLEGAADETPATAAVIDAHVSVPTPARPTAMFLRDVVRAALPWLAAAVVTATSLEPYLSPRAPDPILFKDQTPPAPRRLPKSDPDFGHSFALYSV